MIVNAVGDFEMHTQEIRKSGHNSFVSLTQDKGKLTQMAKQKHSNRRGKSDAWMDEWASEP